VRPDYPRGYGAGASDGRTVNSEVPVAKKRGKFGLFGAVLIGAVAALALFGGAFAQGMPPRGYGPDKMGGGYGPSGPGYGQG
jgi:hypothetical protein